MSCPVCPIHAARAAPSCSGPANETRHQGGALGSWIATLDTKPRKQASCRRIRSAAHAMKPGSTGTVQSSIQFFISLDIIHH